MTGFSSSPARLIRHLGLFLAVVLVSAIRPAAGQSDFDPNTAYAPVAMGSVDTPTSRKGPVFSRASAVMLLKARTSGYEPWILSGIAGDCHFVLRPVSGDTPFGTVSTARRTRLKSDDRCDPANAGARVREIDMVRIEPMRHDRKLMVVASARGEVVSAGELFTPQFSKSASLAAKAQSRRVPQLTDIDGYYLVQPSGISQLRVTRREGDWQAISEVVRVQGEVMPHRAGTIMSSGSWVPGSQRLLRTVRMSDLSCSFPQIASLLVPVVDASGQIIPGLFRSTGQPPDLPAAKRQCMVGSYNKSTCALETCFKWDDHPDFANAPPLYVARDRAQADRLYAAMEKWTSKRHGVEAAGRAARRGSGAPSRDYASEASKRVVEDYLIDLWTRPAQGY